MAWWFIIPVTIYLAKSKYQARCPPEKPSISHFPEPKRYPWIPRSVGSLCLEICVPAAPQRCQSYTYSSSHNHGVLSFGAIETTSMGDYRLEIFVKGYEPPILVSDQWVFRKWSSHGTFQHVGRRASKQRNTRFFHAQCCASKTGSSKCNPELRNFVTRRQNKRRRQVPQGFHGSKQPKLWQFHSDAWALLPPKSVCPCLTLVFGLRPN